MKVKLIFLIAYLVVTSLSAQNSNIEVSIGEVNIGKSVLTNENILATEYRFPKEIHHAYIEGESGLFTIQLCKSRQNGVIKNRGEFLVFDPDSKNVLWRKNIQYNINNLQQYGDVLLFMKKGRSKCLDLTNGMEKWEIANHIYFADLPTNIGMGYIFQNTYRYRERFRNNLEGIDFTDGSVLWDREIVKDYGWNDWMYLNDATLLVAAAGLHSINIKDGSGWDYDAITGSKDYTRVAVANVVGLFVGAMTGTYVVTTGHDIVGGLCSNVLIDSTNIYFAAHDKLSRLNKADGKVIWSYNFPDNRASRSHIYLHNGNVCMLNLGLGLMGHRSVDFGDPLIAFFNQETGKSELFRELDLDGKFVKDYQIEDGTLFILSGQQIVSISLFDGTIQKSIILEEEIIGELYGFVPHEFFSRSDNGKYSPVWSANETNLITYNWDGIVNILNKNFEVVDRTHINQLYFWHKSVGQYKLLIRGDYTIILNDDNIPVAELNIGRDILVKGSTIYHVQKNSLQEIDLSLLVEEN
jgi:outer membrane protein assembly factor BamB